MRQAIAQGDASASGPNSKGRYYLYGVRVWGVGPEALVRRCVVQDQATGSWVKPRKTQPFQTAGRSVSTRSSGSSS